jgi:hypothetical protein
MKNYKIVTALFLLVLTGCAGIPKAIVIPGQTGIKTVSGDDLKEMMVFNERTGFSYTFGYDKDNLFIYLMAEDAALQKKIAYHGFAVWIDRSGEKNREQGFRFPVGLNQDHYRPENIESALGLAGTVELIGIYGSSSRKVKMRDSQVRVRAEIVDGLLLYRAVVPFELLRFGTIEPGTLVKIGLETGFQAASRGEGRQIHQDGRMAGGGMGPRGRRPGDMMPGHTSRMPDRGYMHTPRIGTDELSKPSSLWIELEFQGLP